MCSKGFRRSVVAGRTEWRVDDERDDGKTEMTVWSHRLARQSTVGAARRARPTVHHDDRHPRGC